MIRVTSYGTADAGFEWEGSMALSWETARRFAKQQLKRTNIDYVKLEDDNRGEFWSRHLTKKFQKEEYKCR